MLFYIMLHCNFYVMVH